MVLPGWIWQTGNVTLGPEMIDNEKVTKMQSLLHCNLLFQNICRGAHGLETELCLRVTLNGQKRKSLEKYPLFIGS